MEQAHIPTRSIMVDDFGLKIYGERNTGTNYLFELIEKNLEIPLLRPIAPRWITVPARAMRQLSKITPYSPFRLHEYLVDFYFSRTFSSNLGWKHCLVDCDRITEAIKGSKIKFITMTKNPYAWLLSMYKHPHHGVGGNRLQKIPLDVFLQKKWTTVGREMSPAQFENPIALWNEKNKAYIGLAKKLPVLTLRYEDVLESPAKILSQIEVFCGAARKMKSFHNKNDDAKGNGKCFGYYKNYYLKHEWLSKLSEDHLKIINSHLDCEVMGYFQYSKQ